MNRYQILIEYVGTSYIGWQTQKKGNSIQKTIQNVISKLLKENIGTIKGISETQTIMVINTLKENGNFPISKNNN